MTVLDFIRSLCYCRGEVEPRECLWLQSMDFFNKYKELFEIPPGLSLPRSRLSIDNELFVERVYQGTTKQEYSLTSKLKQLRRDYSAFENEIGELSTIKKTPVRSLSRKDKEPQPKIQAVTIKNNQNEQLSRVDAQQEKQRVVRDSIKREGWLQDERQNILKHSELDHIFNNKLNKIYQLDDIKPSTLPRPSQQSLQQDTQPRQGNFTIKQRSRKSTESRSPPQERKLPSIETALSRRQKAKSTLEFRRKKLEQLLKSLW